MKTTGAVLPTNLQWLIDHLPKKGQIPSQEKQRELHQRYKKGDLEAKDELVMANMRLVLKIVKKIWRPDELTMSDLIQFGVIGLMIAIDKYDPKRNDSFSNYAAICIESATKYYIRPYYNQLKWDYNSLEEHHKLICSKQRITQELGHIPSSEEYAFNLEMPFKKVLELLEFHWKNPISMSDIYDEDHERTFEDCIADRTLPSAQESVNYLVLKEAVQKLLQKAKLSDLQQEVIMLYYGLEDGVERSNAEIAKMKGCSKGNINSARNDAMKKIKKVMWNPDRFEEYHDYLNMEYQDIDSVRWMNASPLESAINFNASKLFYPTIYHVLKNQSKEKVEYILSQLEPEEIENLKLSYGPDGILLKNRFDMTQEQKIERKRIYKKMDELMFLLNHKGIEALKEFSEVQHAENNMGKRRCV